MSGFYSIMPIEGDGWCTFQLLLLNSLFLRNDSWVLNNVSSSYFYS